MNLLSVSLENYLGWGSLDLELARPGLTYFCGPNGSGKSSIRDAIRWCLTGKTERAESADDVIRQDSQGGALVTTRLQVGHDRVSITRARRHRTYANGLFVQYNDDEPIHPRHIRAAQELVEQIAPLAADSVQLDAALSFASTDSQFFAVWPEAEQKRLFRRIYQFGVFERAGLFAKDQARKLQTEHTERIMATEQLKGATRVLEEEVKKLQVTLRHARLQAAIDARQLQVDRTKLEAELHEVETAYAQARAAQEAFLITKSELNREVQYLESTIDQIRQARASKRCPTCDRLLPRKARYRRLADLQQAKAEHLQRIQKLEQVIATTPDIWTGPLTAAEASMRKLRDSLSAVRVQLQYVNQDVKRLRSQLHHQSNAFGKSSKALRQAERAQDLTEEHLRYWDWWVRGFSSRGIELFALEQVLPDFNARIAAILQRTPTRRGVLEHEFQLQGDHLVQVPSYWSRSGGERRRIDFAIACAYRSVLPTESNVCFYDEAWENLDMQGIDQMLQIIRELPIPSVYVMSHRQDLTTRFENVYYFTEVSGACAIERSETRAVERPVL